MRSKSAQQSRMIDQFCNWLAGAPVSQAFQDLRWFVPTVQTVHILCIAVIMTSVGMLAFKLLGLAGRAQPLSVMVASFMPWIWSALVIQLITGTLLTITEPDRELLNLAFRAKNTDGRRDGVDSRVPATVPAP
jgi:hypothetical protein